MVAQLAFHIQSRETEGAADDLLSTLLVGTGASTHRANSVLFAARCLEFMICSPEVVRQVTESAFNTYIEHRSKFKKVSVSRFEDRVEEDVGGNIRNVLRHILFSHRENIEIVAETLRKELDYALLQRPELDAALAAEAVLQITEGVHARAGVRRNQDMARFSRLREYWNEIRKPIISAHAARIRQLSRDHLFLCRAAHEFGLVSLKEILEWHGAAQIFDAGPSSVWVDAYSPLGQPVLFHLLRAPHTEKFDSRLPVECSELEIIAKFLTSTPPPWTENVFYVTFMHNWFHYFPPSGKVRKAPQTYQLSSDAIFVVFCLIAAAVEALKNEELNEPIREMLAGSEFLRRWPILKWALRSKSVTDSSQLDKELDESGFGVEQKNLIRGWVQGTMNFVTEGGRLAKSAEK